MPEDLFDAAKEQLKTCHLERYFCKKYNMPPTDQRYLAYTPEDLIMEYVMDAIEDDRIELDVEGKPAKKVRYKGEEITEIGSEIWDQLERDWVDQGDSDEVIDVIKNTDLNLEQSLLHTVGNDS